MAYNAESDERKWMDFQKSMKTSKTTKIDKILDKLAKQTEWKDESICDDHNERVFYYEKKKHLKNLSAQEQLSRVSGIIDMIKKDFPEVRIIAYIPFQKQVEFEGDE